MKKIISILLVAALLLTSVIGCNGGTEESSTTETSSKTEVSSNAEESSKVEEVVPSVYTYTDSVSTLATNWNPHTYQTTDDAYPADFLRTGLYGFIFNDELHPVEGKDDFAGYVIIPEMAASMPVDVTEAVKAAHPEYNIPESATAGYAYTIDLNPNATWEDGTPITADTYVYSMKKLLDVNLMNYRAADYYSADFVLAGAEAYANSGTTQYLDNGVNAGYTVDQLTLGDDGVYYSPDGNKMFIGLAFALDWCGGDTLKDYVDAYGETYFDVTNWETLIAMADENGLIPLTDENLALFTPVTTGNEAWGETEADLPNYFVYEKSYAEVEYDGTVGLFKSGDYQITIVFAKSLQGFNLLYNLSGNWIVYEDLYESCLKEDNGVWTSTYNTSVETTMSYGPYKMTEYQADKSMRFERNENWYGYTDGQHTYVDPVDGETYDMYMTDVIDTQVVSEAATRKLMFLQGQLMTYGLQSEDFATYRNSEYVHVTPSETIFFLIFNGHMEAIQGREANEGFDQTQYDLETMTLQSFRKAFAVTYDKELFCSTISPARSGGYGIIGEMYIYDPDTGAKYRDTDQAKQALCDFYSVDVTQYASLDEAVDSITGYDPVAAKTLFTQAYDESLAAGYITDADGDGKCDQMIQIEYCMSSDSDFMTQTIDYLNEKLNEVLVGTPFEGKISVIKSALYGNDWSNKIREGLADTVLAGWSGSALNPFSLTDLYTNPAKQYDAEWFDAAGTDMTLTVAGQEVTMNLKQWSDALNGTTVTVNEVEYNFGEGNLDIEERLTILAAIEGQILQTYNYIPMMQNASMALLTQKAYYVIEDYNAVMGRGGIAYLKYNYDDAAWAEYVTSQGGELKY